MIDPLGALIFIGLLGLVTAVCALVVWLANYVADYRDLRRREAEYADAWVRAHRARQYEGHIPARDTKPNRYLTADDRSPE